MNFNTHLKTFKNQPTRRLVATIARRNGVTQTELAEWHVTGWRTTYIWLRRPDIDESLEQAVSDNKLTGRNQELPEARQEELEGTVHESPGGAGIDAPAWTPAFVQEYLKETYGVEYSVPSCRWLLKEARLCCQKPRRSAAEADENGREAFYDELKKAAGGGRHRRPYRTNGEVRAGRAVCRVVSPRHATLR